MLWPEEWPEDVPEDVDMICNNNIYNGKNRAQDQSGCQKECESHSACVGFAWTSSPNIGCFLCKYYNLSFVKYFSPASKRKLRFYRNPTGNY